MTTPILLAALGAAVASQAGCLNMGLEGIMLFSALTGVFVSSLTGSPVWGSWAGLAAGVLIGGALGALLGYLVLTLKTDATLAGVALNTIGSNGTVFLLYVWTGSSGISSSHKSFVLPNVEIPILKDIPVLGTIFSGQNVVTYITFALVIALVFFLYKTPLGLRIRAVGLNPDAADSVGINVVRMRYLAYILSGFLAGIGGAYLTTCYSSTYTDGIVAGRGFIALAAVIFGRWNAGGILLACLFFGFCDALQIRLQVSGIAIPYQFFQMIPYVATVVVLSVIGTKQAGPKANGQPYRREQR